MNHATKIAACLVAGAVLLPASAEAKRRFGGSSSAVTTPTTTKTSRGMIVVPVLGASRARAATDTPQRVPFPPASAQQQDQAPTLLRLTSSDGAQAWCRSEVVVGGFCILN